MNFYSDPLIDCTGNKGYNWMKGGHYKRAFFGQQTRGRQNAMIRLERIVSGGQTGADQAALDVAIELGIPHGGWVPKGRRTEQGPLPEKYRMKEMPTDSYPKRTEQNVIDSDGTLIISHGGLKEGSDYTRRMAAKHGKPWIHIDADKHSVEVAVQMIRTWISGNDIEVLNVAGPPASKDAQIYATTKTLLKAVLFSSYEDG
jgi:NOL1/NOP2/fmu family ribosome biogenesis protein